MESHLLQMRGLKPNMRTRHNIDKLVASFTDAWIETTDGLVCSGVDKSRIFYRCVD